MIRNMYKLTVSLFLFTAFFDIYSMEADNVLHNPTVIESLLGSGKKSMIEQKVHGFFTIKFKDIEGVDESGMPYTRFEVKPYLEDKIELFKDEFAPENITPESYKLLLSRLAQEKSEITPLNKDEHSILPDLGCDGLITNIAVIPFLPLCLTVEHKSKGLNVLKVWSLLSNSLVKEFRFDQSIKELVVKRCTNQIYLLLEQDSLSSLIGIDLVKSDLMSELKWNASSEQKELYLQAVGGSLKDVIAKAAEYERLLGGCPKLMKEVIEQAIEAAKESDFQKVINLSVSAEITSQSLQRLLNEFCPQQTLDEIIRELI